jgi:hypothetical protein
VMGATVELVQDDQRLRPPRSEVERLCAATEKARRLLNWTPRFTGRDGLMRGLAETVTWFEDDANLARYKADVYNI